MRIDLITALPDLVASPLSHSIIERAQRKGLIDIRVHDLRAFGIPKGKSGHTQIDDYPYGGGGGMVLKPEPLFACIEALQAALAEQGASYDEVIFLTPDGVTLDQPLANRLSLHGNLLLIAGHYKGIDQRVRDTLVTMEVSIGDYVLSGGELPALVLIDALCRIVPGVIGDAQSALSDSFQDGLLDAPVYTRPETFRGQSIPEVLRSGDHAKISAWRETERLTKTRERRPDLLGE
ncbi:MAG: tRNA (guanosine(37)-N1)-methyltransferase TrmD [Bacteroidota bacterium]